MSQMSQITSQTSHPPSPELAPPPPRREEEEEEEETSGNQPETSGYRLGSRRCRRCHITFPDSSFAARHAKRCHPRDFAAAALQGALFVCFVCSRPFGSSPALLRHQRGHAHPPPAPAPGKATPSGGKATPPLECRECGRRFSREGALHRHYIRHARGEL